MSKLQKISLYEAIALLINVNTAIAQEDYNYNNDFENPNNNYQYNINAADLQATGELPGLHAGTGITIRLEKPANIYNSSRDKVGISI